MTEMVAAYLIVGCMFVWLTTGPEAAAGLRQFAPWARVFAVLAAFIAWPAFFVFAMHEGKR